MSLAIIAIVFFHFSSAKQTAHTNPLQHKDYELIVHNTLFYLCLVGYFSTSRPISFSIYTIQLFWIISIIKFDTSMMNDVLLARIASVSILKGMPNHTYIHYHNSGVQHTFTFGFV